MILVCRWLLKWAVFLIVESKMFFATTIDRFGPALSLWLRALAFFVELRVRNRAVDFLMFFLTVQTAGNQSSANHWLSGLVTVLIQSMDKILSPNTRYSVFKPV
ncbi:hypothetical protein THS27_06195 [Thalassospira sp. MCCC 1A01428]|nr:hypothetical protein THS27_06195 [Thalassospira sp. MCCC 1A01428]